MFLKRLFYACGSILMLVLAYHFGARSAEGQTASGIVCATLDSNGAYAVIGSYLYSVNNGAVVTKIPDGVPGHAVACWGSGVLLDDGRYMVYVPQWGGWNYFGSLPVGGPTATQQRSWGAMKSQYRGERVVAPSNR